MLFDSHAHLEDERFDDDRDELIRGLPGRGVTHVVNVGSTLDTSRMSVDLAAMYPGIYAAVGIHPHEVSQMTYDDLNPLKTLQEAKVAAIGEIGLVYDLSQGLQRQWFSKQIELACRLKLQ